MEFSLSSQKWGHSQSLRKVCRFDLNMVDLTALPKSSFESSLRANIA